MIQILIHGLPKNSDKVTGECVVKTIVKMRKLILVQILIDFNDWVDQEESQIKHDP